MKKILLFIAAPVLALVLASLIIYHFVNINDYKANIIALVKEKTSQEISINGDVRIRILPDIALDISDVFIKSKNNDDPENAVAVEQIIMHLRLIPLLKREIEVSSLKLVNPVVIFHIFKDGTNNFVEGIPEEKTEVITFEKRSTYIREFINNKIINKFYLDNLVIEDAKLTFKDEQRGLDVNIFNINAQTSFVPGNNLLKISAQIQPQNSVDTAFSIEGQYQLAKDFYELSTLAIKLGDIETHGEAGVDFRATMPDIKIAFYFDNMNLNPYASIIDLVMAPKTPEAQNIKHEKSGKEPYIWTKQPLDLGMLRNFNGHFSFKSNNILYKDTSIGSVTMNSYLRNGKFTLSIKEAEMFGGNINGEVVVDASSNIAKIRHKINLEEIDLTKLPASAGFITNVGGRLSGGVLLTSRGISQMELINNVDGSISLRIDDGFIKGIDLIGMAKNTTAAFTIGKNLDQKTIFKEFAGDFDVRDGIIKTENLTFGSDLLDFNGQGTVNLPELTIDYKMMPKVKKAKDEADILGGMRAPILITGSLFQPSFRLEMQTLVEDLIKNPKGTENLVKQIKRDFEDIKDNMKSDDNSDSSGVVKDIKNIFNGF